MTNKKELSISQEQEEIEKGIKESRTKYRKVIQAGIGQWIKDFQAGDIKIQSVDDLQKLIRLDIELQRSDLRDLRFKNKPTAK
ncbi:hypothetical protein H1S01_03285 [Heliobacterium chlorum]|uniref:Uncharacterized protein n=1 Tax=Heliobacterium chlorum TaxID=2698 RepID=A0ABR7T0T4_HELCL|nr:hypothetical protein [Heliobacterium chlorum]MBC9783535.1 hypothetical protein [Heliobacterium chlorum]